MNDDIDRAAKVLREYIGDGQPFDATALADEVLGEIERENPGLYLRLYDCGPWAIRRAIELIAKERHG